MDHIFGPLSTIKIEKDKEQIKKNYIQIIKYPDDMTYENMVMTLMTDLKEEVNTSSFVPISGKAWTVDDPFTFEKAEQINQNDDYYTFKNCHGISSKHTSVRGGKIRMDKLTNDYIEMRVCSIKGFTYDAVSNIRVNVINLWPNIEECNFEIVLRVNGNLLVSQTISNKITSQLNSNVQQMSCELINFPNFILNTPEEQQHIEIYMRGKNSLLLHKTPVPQIEYDVILFNSTSRYKIFYECAKYIFEMATGVICVGTERGVYGVRYMTQLINTVSPHFQHLYASIKLPNKEGEGEQEEINELTENIIISI